MQIVRLHVSGRDLDNDIARNQRVGWSICVLAMACSGLMFGLLGPSGILHLDSVLAISGVAVAFGAMLALVVNKLRPTYDHANSRWKVFYDLLLRQVPPPD